MAFGLVVLVGSWGSAAATDQHFSVQGSVLDPSGAAILAADVELRAPSGSVLAQTATDRTGRFQLTAENCSPCTLTVYHPGFATYSRDVSTTANINIQLAIAKVSTRVDVLPGRPATSTETTENRNTTELDTSSLNELPILDQDYIGFLQQFLDSGMLGTNGVTLVVNGAEANGPGVSASAVQSVKINNNPYSALFARPGKARLEITTVGGTPQFHGRINASFRDSKFDATPAFAFTKPQERRRYVEGSLTGPISNLHKTAFLASAQYDTADDFAVVDAVTPAGPVNTTVPQPQTHAFVSGRVFHDYGSGNQFWIGYSYENTDRKNQYVGGLWLPETGVHDHNEEHELNFQNTTVISPKWINQLRLLVGHYDHPITDNTHAAQVRVLGAFVGGSAQANSRRTEAHLDGNDIVTYSAGKHELKFGIDVPDLSRRGEDDFADRMGVYTYASLAAYQNANAELLQLKQGEGHLTFWELTFAGLIEDTYRATPNFTVTAGARYYFQNFFHDEPHNIAPRLGLAWRPGTKSKYVIRGGAGLFYDRSGPRAIAELLHYDLDRMRQYVIDNPANLPLNVLTQNQPYSVTRISPSAVIPYTAQWSVSLERQVFDNAAVSVEYSSMRGIDQFRTLDLNAPSSGSIVRPDPVYGQLRTYDSAGHSRSDGLELNFSGPITKHFQGQANYRFAHAYSNTDGISYLPADSYRPDLDWGPASWDVRHRFYLLGTTQLPYKLKLGLVFRASTGQPYNVTTGSDNNYDGVLVDRPAGVTRNSLRAAGSTELDVKFGRDFLLTKKADGMAVSANVMATNVLNHTNYTGYIGVITSPYFRLPTSADAPRRLQANLSFRF